MTTVAVLMPTLPGRTELRVRALASYDKQRLPSDWNVTLYLTTTPHLLLAQS
jgi:hypothetical protein